MVNDLTTLSGALIECKDQLISELANQGVTATYDPSTGLLGLIHKISEITPQGDTIVLVSSKSTLSQADSESATLTATHSQGAGKTVEIYNATTGTKIGDATDNQDGTYTYTYNSQGVGDISMTATSGALESNAITIHDCILYDPASSSNLTKYTIPTGLSFTFDTDHYVATLNNQNWKNLNRTFTSNTTKFTLEYDALFTSSKSNTQLGTYLFSTQNLGMVFLTSPIDSVCVLAKSNGVENYQNRQDANYTYTRDVWYHIETIVDSNSTTTNLYLNNTLVSTLTNNYISFTDLNNIIFSVGWESGATVHLKNIKVKPL